MTPKYESYRPPCMCVYRWLFAGAIPFSVVLIMDVIVHLFGSSGALTTSITSDGDKDSQWWSDSALSFLFSWRWHYSAFSQRRRCSSDYVDATQFPTFRLMTATISTPMTRPPKWLCRRHLSLWMREPACRQSYGMIVTLERRCMFTTNWRNVVGTAATCACGASDTPLFRLLRPSTMTSGRREAQYGGCRQKRPTATKGHLSRTRCQRRWSWMNQQRSTWSKSGSVSRRNGAVAQSEHGRMFRGVCGNDVCVSFVLNRAPVITLSWRTLRTAVGRAHAMCAYMP